MPLITAYTNIGYQANVTSAQFNTPFNALYNLINGGGSPAGIDFNNVTANANIPWSYIVPNTSTASYVLPASLFGIGASATYSVGPSSPVMNSGDISSALSATTGSVTFGSSSPVTFDYNVLNTGGTTIGRLGANMVPVQNMPFGSNQNPNNSGAMLPCYTSTGASVALNTKIVYGVAPAGTGFTQITLSNAAAMSNTNYFVIASPMNPSGTNGAPTVQAVVNSPTQFTIYSYSYLGTWSTDTSNGFCWMAIGA
jgi:hypothetical protein